MAAKKQPRPDLSEEARQERQEAVYRLHCRGLTQRAIGAELGLDSSQVSRALTKVRAALHKQKGEEHLADLADRLTEGAWEDLAESWRLARQIEEMAAAADYRSIAVERSNRAKLRDQIAKFNGLDHLKQRELALRERQAEAAERGAKAATDLAAQLGQHGWLCAVPEGPEE